MANIIIIQSLIINIDVVGIVILGKEKVLVVLLVVVLLVVVVLLFVVVVVVVVVFVVVTSRINFLHSRTVVYALLPDDATHS